jgi:predicted MFS family arabinose efflux permease
MVRVGIHSTYAGTLLPSFVLLALGLGFAFVPVTLIGVSSVEGEDAGLASGLFNTAQQVGGALGLAILSTVAASHTSQCCWPGVATSVIARGRDSRPSPATGSRSSSPPGS